MARAESLRRKSGPMRYPSPQSTRAALTCDRRNPAEATFSQTTNVSFELLPALVPTLHKRWVCVALDFEAATGHFTCVGIAAVKRWKFFSAQ